jgi:hypothetical protein
VEVRRSYSPFLFRSVEVRRSYSPFLSRSVGGEGRATYLPSDVSYSPFLSRSAGEEGGWGEGEGHQAYSAAPALQPLSPYSAGTYALSTSVPRHPLLRITSLINSPGCRSGSKLLSLSLYLVMSLRLPHTSVGAFQRSFPIQKRREELDLGISGRCKFHPSSSTNGAGSAHSA